MSNSRPTLEESVTFFLDRTHQSKDTARLLRKLGVQLVLHREKFDPEAPDPEWIPVCAENGWIILSGDKGLENVGLNRAAVIKCAAKVFLIHDYQTQGLDQTAALITARKKIMRVALRNAGPFYCSVEMAGDDHVGRPEFQPGGYPLGVEDVPECALAAPKRKVHAKPLKRRDSKPAKKDIPETQSFDFPNLV